MTSILKILNNLNCIKCNTDDVNIINLYNEHSFELICTILIKEKKFISHLTDDYDDIYRILDWFGFRNPDNVKKFTTKCNGLGCENCTGCAFNTLNSLYASKVILNKYVDKVLTENYTFIGNLSLDESLFLPSTFKTYIKYDHENYSYVKYIDSSWNTYKIHGPIERNLYIEQLIPELLSLNNFSCDLYGIYKNKAVRWRYENSESRLKWVFEELF